MKVLRVGKCLAQVGESPLWDAKTGAIYWVDIVGQRIFRTRLEGETDMIDLAEPVGSIVCTTSGSLLAALRSGVFKLSFDAPCPELVGAPSGYPPGHRFNDSTTDAQGNLIVGTVSLAAPVIDHMSSGTATMATPIPNAIHCRHFAGWKRNKHPVTTNSVARLCRWISGRSPASRPITRGVDKLFTQPEPRWSST